MQQPPTGELGNTSDGVLSGHTKRATNLARTKVRTRNTANTATWQQMMARAVSGGVTVRQLTGSGAWVATSGTDTDAAYEVSLFGAGPRLRQSAEFHDRTKRSLRLGRGEQRGARR